jgi:hypothetical protein
MCYTHRKPQALRAIRSCRAAAAIIPNHLLISSPGCTPRRRSGRLWNQATENIDSFQKKIKKNKIIALLSTGYNIPSVHDINILVSTPLNFTNGTFYSAVFPVPSLSVLIPTASNSPNRGTSPFLSTTNSAIACPFSVFVVTKDVLSLLRCKFVKHTSNFEPEPGTGRKRNWFECVCESY